MWGKSFEEPAITLVEFFKRSPLVGGKLELTHSPEFCDVIDLEAGRSGGD